MKTCNLCGRGRAGRARGLEALALVLVALLPTGLAAQSDTTVLVTPGAEYAAGGTKRTLLGEDYRDLWTTPIRVPVLNLRSYAGGLEAVERGGGKQTRVLQMRNTEGREYVFRSVNKDPAMADEPALQNTLVSDIVQDQVSALHPAAAAMVAPLLDAVGILHPEPVLVVMPDDPALGEFRSDFAGVLGWIEERPDEIEPEEDEEPRPGFGGYERITGTERLLERLEESAEDRAETRDFLTARLVDLIVGDWDRHGDQWRWAEEERDGVSYWIPIARDRDYAMVNYDGFLIRAAGSGISNLVEFGPRITNLNGLTLNARELDRRLLSGLSIADWDSIIAFVQERLTDEVIADAVSRMPPELRARDAERTAARLRGRRDDIGRVAREFYARLATDVDIRGTDEDDVAIVERVADGVVRVRLHERSGETNLPDGDPYYQRTFYAPETRDVRIFLHGGDDYAVVRGDVLRTLTVRVIGGGGDDVMVDSSYARISSAPTAFYDSRGENRLVRGKRTRVDTREYEMPDSVWELSGETFRDWGDSRSLSAVIDYRGTEGLIIGGGPTYTRYGFRSSPYSSRIGARARIGLISFRPAIEVFGDFRREGSPWGHGFHAEATRLENFRFFGFGNDTEPIGDTDLYLVRQDQISLRGTIDRWSRDGLRFGVGPAVVYTNPDVVDGSPIGELPRYGNDGFAQVGGWMSAVVDRREGGAYARRGLRLEVGGDLFTGWLTGAEPFGSLGGSAATYLTARAPVEATLALRAGAERVWGAFPVHESAFLGGSSNLRGYSYQRFAGDQLAFGNAELRVPVTQAVLIVRGTLGAIALADAGRVWYDGASAGDWHTSAGGGLWFEFKVREVFFGASALYARGEDGGRFYLTLGAPF